MKKNKKRPANKKPLWAIEVNLNGPHGYDANGNWNKQPVKVFWNKDLCAWYDKSGMFEVKSPGLDVYTYGNYCTFASESKNEVEIFLLGACTMFNIFGSLFKEDEEDLNE